MQAINRIQNAAINANASIQGAIVVASANAHRAYTSFKPCEKYPVSKCPETSWQTTTMDTMSSPHTVPSVDVVRSVRGSVRGMRQMQSSHQMPGMLWATLVLNRQLCG